MSPAGGLLARVDHAQRDRPWLAFPVAVLRKFGEDQAGNLAALIAYYAFFSFFPLLLVFVTVLGYVVAGHPGVQDQVIGTIKDQFPGLGGAIVPSGKRMKGSGFGLAVGIVLALWAGLGVGNAAQNGFNTVWQVPVADRPGLAKRTLRSVGLVAVIGLNVLVTTAISGLSSGIGSFGFGFGERLLVIVSLVVNIALFTVAFRILTVRDVGIGAVLPGAIVSAVCWQILQWFGGYLISQKLSTANSTYGTFAIVIGLLTWFFVVGQLVLLATELNVVRARRLWPRTLSGPPRTEADRRASLGYARTQLTRPGIRVELHFDTGEAIEAGTATGTTDDHPATSTTGDGPPDPAADRAAHPTTGDSPPEDRPTGERDR